MSKKGKLIKIFQWDSHSALKRKVKTFSSAYFRVCDDQPQDRENNWNWGHFARCSSLTKIIQTKKQLQSHYLKRFWVEMSNTCTLCFISLSPHIQKRINQLIIKRKSGWHCREKKKDKIIKDIHRLSHPTSWNESREKIFLYPALLKMWELLCNDQYIVILLM